VVVVSPSQPQFDSARKLPALMGEPRDLTLQLVEEADGGAHAGPRHTRCKLPPSVDAPEASTTQAR